VSLINELLRDLEKRHASGPEMQSLSPTVRALPRRSRSETLLLAAAFLVAISGALFYFYSRSASHIDRQAKNSQPSMQSALHRTDGTAATSSPAQAQMPATGPAPEPEPAVREALTVPVFQFVKELSELPASPATAARPPRREAAKKATLLEKQPVEKQAVAKQPQDNSGEKKPVAAAVATAPPAPATAGEADLVVIPETSTRPVEKQMREPTAYEKAELAFRAGVAKLRQGRVSDAENGFRGALKEDSSHAAARQALIGLLVDAGRNEDAQQVLREALEANPRQIRHAMLLARLQMERGNSAGALATLEAVKPYAGTDAEYLAFLAAAYQRTGQHQAAADLYGAALTLAPNNAVWWTGFGISLQALGQPAQAREAFQRAADSKILSADLQKFVDARLKQLPAPKKK
jgi:MSHA biogenesis protein MshN